MRVGALRPYEAALGESRMLGLHTDDGLIIDLDVQRWLGSADEADRDVLRRCTAPTLDVGCGPGRFVEALVGSGHMALGVDIAGTAIALTRARGMPALLRDVFADVPGSGRWPTVLLMDGNIGIGADPLRLLTRIRTLLAPSGRVIVEADPDPEADAVLAVRFSLDGEICGSEFEWARVGSHAIERYGADAGLRVEESWSCLGRSFLSLRPAARPSRTTRTR